MTANRRELPLLNNPQQFSLQRQRKCRHLIEKKCALPSRGEQPLMIGCGAGKGALLMAKQLGLNKMFIKICTVYGNKRL